MQEKPALDITTLSQAVAIGTVALYALGFVVVNAYLARWNTASLDLANAQYLAAGLQFASLLAIFSFVVWRRVLHFSGDIEGLSKMGAELRWSRAWFLFCRLQVSTELLFATVAGAVWTASLLYDLTKEQKHFAGLLIVFYALDYILLVRKRVYIMRPFVALSLAFLAHVAIIFVAIFYFVDASIYSILLIFAALLVTAVLISDVADTLKISLKFKCFWVATALLGTAAAFGDLAFQNVKSSIGGGEARNVEIYFAQPIPAELLNSLDVRTDPPVRVTQLAETSSFMILAADENSKDVIRVSKQAIVAVRPYRKVPESGASQHFQRPP